MSDFSLSLDQRRRLLAEDYKPLHFKGALDPDNPRERLPYGCKPGAVYVLAYGREWAVRGGELVRLPPTPMWFITVTKVLGGPDNRRERPNGDWLVKFDTVDRRCQQRYMRRWPMRPEFAGGEQDYTTSPVGAVDDLSVWDRTPQMHREAQAIAKRDELLRLERVAAQAQERRRVKRDRARTAERSRGPGEVRELRVERPDENGEQAA